MQWKIPLIKTKIHIAKKNAIELTLEMCLVGDPVARIAVNKRKIIVISKNLMNHVALVYVIR